MIGTTISWCLLSPKRHSTACITNPWAPAKWSLGQPWMRLPPKTAHPVLSHTKSATNRVQAPPPRLLVVQGTNMTFTSRIEHPGFLWSKLLMRESDVCLTDAPVLGVSTHSRTKPRIKAVGIGPHLCGESRLTLPVSRSAVVFLHRRERRIWKESLSISACSLCCTSSERLSLIVLC